MGLKTEFTSGIAILTLATAMYINRPFFTQSYHPRNLEATLVEAHGYLQESYNGILITGTKEYIMAGKKALDLIKKKDPYHWQIVQRNITRITLNGHPGITMDNGRFTSSASYSKSETWFAGSIVHDAWHRQYFRNWETYSGREGEKKCMEKQNNFLRRVGHSLLNIEDRLRTEYWKIGYEQRKW